MPTGSQVLNSSRQPLIDVFCTTNAQLNLSAVRDPKDIYVKHILDSLELSTIFHFRKNTTVCDVGMGGGFPLLPLAISNPETHFVGLDSVRKKVEAVKKMGEELNIHNCTFVRSRAEDVKEQYDVVVTRAVAYTDKLLTFTAHLVKAHGILVFYKMFTEEEEKDLKKLLPKFKLSLHKKHLYRLFPEDIERVIYVMKKK